MKKKGKKKYRSPIEDIPPMTFNVLSLRFTDGIGLDIPYQPWMPKQTINLPGRWIRDEEQK